MAKDATERKAQSTARDVADLAAGPDLDAEGLKDLSAQRRRVVSALSRQTAQLAREAGHQLSESAQQDLEATLRAVLADPDAADQWAGGRKEILRTATVFFVRRLAGDVLPADRREHSNTTTSPWAARSV